MMMMMLMIKNKEYIVEDDNIDKFDGDYVDDGVDGNIEVDDNDGNVDIDERCIFYISYILHFIGFTYYIFCN